MSDAERFHDTVDQPLDTSARDDRPLVEVRHLLVRIDARRAAEVVVEETAHSQQVGTEGLRTTTVVVEVRAETDRRCLVDAAAHARVLDAHPAAPLHDQRARPVKHEIAELKRDPRAEPGELPATLDAYGRV